MKSERIVSWLRDKAARAEGLDYQRMLKVAADKIVELEKELRDEKWISVTEKMPDNFVSVLGFMTDAGPFPAVRECYTIGNAFYFPALKDVQPVSCWRPMPEEPEEGV